MALGGWRSLAAHTHQFRQSINLGRRNCSRPTPSSHLGFLVSATLASLATFGTLGAIAPQATATIMPQATSAARTEQREQLVRQVRPDNYDLSQHPLTDANERFWRNMLWTTAVIEPQETYVAEAIAQILTLTRQSTLSEAQQHTVEMSLQVGTQLYLSNPPLYTPIATQFQQTVESSTNAEWVAMALSALVKVDTTPTQRQTWSHSIQQRFPQWFQNVRLFTTLRDLSYIDYPATMPPLSDLLDWQIAPGQLQMYVFCQPDRGVLCQAVLKDGEGHFVRQDGRLWSVPLAVRSLHSLAWNFTRGQTPQGIYRIEGVRSPSTDTFRAYGQFPLIKLFVPYEPGVQQFLPNQPGEFTGGLSAYQTLLPPSWRNYFPMQQTFWAGQAGRSFFRIHGSGDAPTLFTNNSRYPNSNGWNPTIGCLSAMELYDADGNLQRADMPTILNALTTLGGQNFTGYLVVVEIPGEPGTPISLDMIEGAIVSVGTGREL